MLQFVLAFLKFHHEINILKNILLYKNIYPLDFVDKCIRNILDRVLMPEIVVSAVSKKNLMILLPQSSNCIPD